MLREAGLSLSKTFITQAERTAGSAAPPAHRWCLFPQLLVGGLGTQLSLHPALPAAWLHPHLPGSQINAPEWCLGMWDWPCRTARLLEGCALHHGSSEEGCGAAAKEGVLSVAVRDQGTHCRSPGVFLSFWVYSAPQPQLHWVPAALERERSSISAGTRGWVLPQWALPTTSRAKGAKLRDVSDFPCGTELFFRLQSLQISYFQWDVDQLYERNLLSHIHEHVLTRAGACRISGNWAGIDQLFNMTG